MEARMETITVEEVASTASTTQNCTGPSCGEEGGSSIQLTVYLVVTAVFLACAGLAVCWRWRNRRRSWFNIEANQAQLWVTPPDLACAGHPPAASQEGFCTEPEPEPDPDRCRVANAHYENVIVMASDHADSGECVKPDQEYMEFDPSCRLADEEGVYDNDASTAIYCNHRAWDLARDDDEDNTYVFPDRLLQQGQSPYEA